MSPSYRLSRKLIVLSVFGLAAGGSRAAEREVPSLGVAGGSVSVSEDSIDVQVELKGVGGKTGAVTVDGELFGSHSAGEVSGGIPPGERRVVSLRFPPDVPLPGTHPLSLLLDYTAGDPEQGLSQRAYLLLAFGQNADPAVRMTLDDSAMDWAGTEVVHLESVDGEPHGVHLRIQGPRGLRVDNPKDEIHVPAKGPLIVRVPIFRGTLPWDTLQGVLGLATTGGPLAHTTASTGVVRISRDPAWLPRFFKPLVLLALLLLGVAAFAEARRHIG